jgi:hypothetical protein
MPVSLGRNLNAVAPCRVQRWLLDQALWPRPNLPMEPASARAVRVNCWGSKVSTRS